MRAIVRYSGVLVGVAIWGLSFVRRDPRMRMAATLLLRELPFIHHGIYTSDRWKGSAIELAHAEGFAPSMRIGWFYPTSEQAIVMAKMRGGCNHLSNDPLFSGNFVHLVDILVDYYITDTNSNEHKNARHRINSTHDWCLIYFYQ